MLTLLQLALMSADVYVNQAETGTYTSELARAGWRRSRHEYKRLNFFARIYTMDERKLSVLAYRGTNDVMDLANDFLVGLKVFGTPQSGAAHWALSQSCKNDPAPAVLTGHSLGGALAQLMGARHKFPFVSFNAPGMHFERIPNTLLRGAGNAVSSLAGKTSSQVAPATFEIESGTPSQLNIRIKGDLFSFEAPFGISKNRTGPTWSDLETVRPRRTVLGSHKMDTLVDVMRSDSTVFIR